MEYRNVLEPYVLYDTVVVCALLKNTEVGAGFFTTFQQFGRQRHLMFKRRSKSIVNLAYCNMDSEDRVDFPFHIFGAGLSFMGPCTPFDVEGASSSDAGGNQEYLPSFWCGELPRHTTASLKIGQDTKLQIQSMMASPGYGPVTHGAALGIDNPEPDTKCHLPEFVWTTTQGTANHCARYSAFTLQNGQPNPIEVPKGESIELEIQMSEQATNVLRASGGPGNYIVNKSLVEVPVMEYYPTRYMIQASLWGYREVQQRGELHAAGYGG
jgi:hypothetical protein